MYSSVVSYQKYKGKNLKTIGTLRCFIAIELPGNITKALAQVQDELAATGVDIRWVMPENIHLTLKFLGDIKEDHPAKIINMLSPVCSSYPEFDLEISGAGVFPSMRSPRVLWAGVTDDSVLSILQHDIESGLAALGFKKENRKFVSHLTLGRFRTSRGSKTLLNRLNLYEEKIIGAMRVSSVSLIRSELRPEGSRYSKIADLPLRA